MTVATLGLQIDSGQAASAATNLDKVTAAARRAESSFGATERAATLTGYRTKQLSFQLFDIAQALPTVFDSPRYALLNLAVQTGQIVQQYQGEGGLKQAFADTRNMAGRLAESAKAVGPALLAGLVTPLGLAGLGFAAFGVAAATALAIIISKLPNVDHALAQHKDAIERIRAAWKDAEKGSDEYRKRTLASMQFIANQDRLEQQRLLDFQLRGAVNQLSGISIQFGITPTQRALKEFQPDIDRFLASVASGKDDVQGFSAAIDMRANIDPTNIALQNAAKALHEVIDGARDSAQRLKDLRGEFVNLRIDSAFAAASQGPTPAEQAARDLDAARRRHQVELDAIAARSPADRAAVARGFESALPMNENESPAGRQFRIDAAGAEAYAAALHAVSEAEIARKVARDNAIESAKVDLSLVGKGIAEQARLTEQTQMLQQAREAARQAGTIVSDEEVAQIKAAADELGKLNEQIALTQLRSDLGFDRSQLFRSPIDQRVADQLREIYGDDFISHMHDFEAQQIRINERLKELDDIGRDVTKGALHDFFDGLREGQGAFESLETAGLNALTKIENKLIDMVADQAWNSIFGLLGKSLLGGGLSSGAAGLTGAGLFHSGGVVGAGGVTRYVHPAYFDNAPRLHRGMGPDEFPAILQRGERVIPRSGASAAAPNVNIRVINNGPPLNAQVGESQPDDNGGFRTDVMIDPMIAGSLSKPRVRKAAGLPLSIKRR